MSLPWSCERCLCLLRPFFRPRAQRRLPSTSRRAPLRYRAFSTSSSSPSLSSPLTSISPTVSTLKSPKLLRSLLPLPSQKLRRWNSRDTALSSSITDNDQESLIPEDNLAHDVLPPTWAGQACPGCGAPAQSSQPGIAGHYTMKRLEVRRRIKQLQDNGPAVSQSGRMEDEKEESVQLLKPEEPHTHGLPLCDRCHTLIHHNSASPIAHPSIDSIYETMQESAYKYNHVYHVLDAADFPMSLIPKIHQLLDLAPLRSRNRRAKDGHFKHGRSTELSFIITRSDLLAPTKEQVDSLMPSLVSVLRDALGSTGQNVRLGNVKCVSAKRGWWTRDLKQTIWERGGATWMVGKVNVGKSNLFDVIFPKGQAEVLDLQSLKDQARAGNMPSLEQLSRGEFRPSRPEAEPRQTYDDISLFTPERVYEEKNILLPPARPEVPYPVMPTISSTPGTTASPIRIPFGGGKGELIDLPGMTRSPFVEMVKPEHRDTLIMRKRVVPTQFVLRPGQSLMLGGLVRITPVDQDLFFLAHPFINFKPHLTSTPKALEYESGARSADGLPLLASDDTAARPQLKLAGTYALKWDVTKERAGPLTSRAAGNRKAAGLPFQVFSADILIEEIGWVEMSVQVRRRQQHRLARPKPRAPLDPEAELRARLEGGVWPGPNGEHQDQASSEDTAPVAFPQVQVFSPEGKHVAVRRSLGAWMLNKPLQSKARSAARPRRQLARILTEKREKAARKEATREKQRRGDRRRATAQDSLSLSS